MEEMFKKYSPMVFRYLKGLCGDEDLAEELMQETFYQAVKSIDRYDGTCKPSTWLCQIAKHMWLRELKRRERLSVRPPDESMFPADSFAEDHISDRQELLSLLQKIHCLNPEAREVVLLRINGDLSFKEIGEIIMGHSESWARVTFYRAKKKLKEMMSNENEM